MFSGEPFYVANVSQLNAGQTFAAVSLQFSDPGLLPFTYRVTVIDGPPPGLEPAGTIAAGDSRAVGFVANEGQTDAQSAFPVAGRRLHAVPHRGRRRAQPAQAGRFRAGAIHSQPRS